MPATLDVPASQEEDWQIEPGQLLAMPSCAGFRPRPSEDRSAEQSQVTSQPRAIVSFLVRDGQTQGAGCAGRPPVAEVAELASAEAESAEVGGTKRVPARSGERGAKLAHSWTVGWVQQIANDADGSWSSEPDDVLRQLRS